jgi:predicted AAA+ superfamily ATPase
MTDSGMMSSILSWRREDLKLQPDSLGKLIETFAFNELSTQVDTKGGEYELYHYRDREQREIDFLVERDDGAVLGLEIKSSTVATRDDFKHLIWFKSHIAKDREFVGIVLYTGLQPLQFGHDMWAIPFSMLWPKV